jgi:hypothetical protein
MVQCLLTAFYDEKSLEIKKCRVLCLQKKPQDVNHTDWKVANPQELRFKMASLLYCERCAAKGDGQGIVPICTDLLPGTRGSKRSINILDMEHAYDTANFEAGVSIAQLVLFYTHKIVEKDTMNT